MAELNALRSSAASAVTSEAGLKSLESYAAQLECLIPRFPVTASGPLEVRVGWNNTFTGQGMPGTTLHFEYANVLYNIGATRVRGPRARAVAIGLGTPPFRAVCSAHPPKMRPRNVCERQTWAAGSGWPGRAWMKSTCEPHAATSRRRPVCLSGWAMRPG